MYERRSPAEEPHDAAPDPARIRAVWRRLRDHLGGFAPRSRRPVLDQVVGTVLSQHTSDRNSERAFALLKQRFPDWEQVLDAPHEEVADAIRCGGIADRKAATIQRILAAVEEREGRLDLERLRRLDDAAVEEYLTSLPGVGPKTAACVLVFAMERDAFPVDTHVHRVATRLGWIPPGTSADKAHRLLAPAVPPEIRYELHVALIAHGRTVCRAGRPRCEECVLLDVCPYGAAATGRASRP
jgi:endonuclease-3